MKFTVETDYLDTIEITKYQWVEVGLPDGRHVKVYADQIYLRSPDDQLKHRDGRKIWDG